MNNEERKEEARLRKIEYNKNPHLCELCHKPILMKETDKYRDIFKKRFCSLSCASKYGHIICPDNKPVNENPKINNFSDEEIIKLFNESKNQKDFESKIGYKSISNQKIVLDKLLSLGLDINSIKDKNIDVVTLTKKEIFERYKYWQTARSAIQKIARKNYENSNKPKKCIVCGYDKHYEVAHIKSVSDFEDNTLISEINDINNLIALCPNHHWEYDNTDFDITLYL